MIHFIMYNLAFLLVSTHVPTSFLKLLTWMSLLGTLSLELPLVIKEESDIEGAITYKKLTNLL